MKQSDIITLIFIAGIGMLASFLIANHFMGDPDMQSIKFKKLTTPITADLVEPDPEVFNTFAINPTIEVHVGDCEDLDGNGILEDSELIACGMLEAPETQEDEIEVDPEPEPENQEPQVEGE